MIFVSLGMMQRKIVALARDQVIKELW